MTIRPVDLNGMIQRTQDIGNIKHQEDAKPLVDQQNIQSTVVKEENKLAKQVNHSDNADHEDYRYDAKEKGFVPGGMSLHNMMLPHGPDTYGFEKATNSELQPVKLSDTMAFMFETRFPQQITQFAAELETRQDDYHACWDDLERRFDGTPGLK